ncbi:MAG: toprim domain-containing protein [Candidatus Paceibacterota bacterium]|jgi:recombination protein RecR
MSESVQKLTELFSKFPGIGPRQARRFVYHLLEETESSRGFLAQKILSLKSEMMRCSKCKRFFSVGDAPHQNLCPLCADTARDSSLLMVVARDVDLESVEKTKQYSGNYFVLGGQLKILDKNPESRIRIIELEALLHKSPDIKEIIIAMNANTEGDYTADYVRQKLTESFPTRDLKITVLGRGLSTGTELEYSDSETITYALKNRF